MVHSTCLGTVQLVVGKTIEESGSDEFALKFSAVRWIESLSVAERCIKIWPGLEKTINKYKKLCASRQPKCKSYEHIASAVEDELILPKLEFFCFIAKIMKPFLTKHQSDAPLAPFLYEDLKALVLKLLKLVIKPDVMDTLTSQSKITKLDLTNRDNFKKPHHFNIGTAADQKVKSQSRLRLVEDIEVFNFQHQCKDFICGIVTKLLERSPVSQPVAKWLSLFNPSNLAVKDKSNLETMMKRFVDHLASKKILPANDCDQAYLEYGDFLAGVQKNEKLKLCKAFDRDNERLDDFYFKKLNVGAYPYLTKVCQLVFCLSHGQASVERGFSVNKNIAKHNMTENAFICRRLIKDHLLAKNVLPAEFEITPQLALAVTGAKREYEKYLEDQRKSKSSAVVVTAVQVSREHKINEMQNDRKGMVKERDVLQAQFNKLFNKAVMKSDMNLIHQSSGLKTRLDEMNEAIHTLDASLEDLKRC